MPYPTQGVHFKKPVSLFVVVVIILVSYFFSLKGISQDMIRRDELTTLGHIGALESGSDVLSIADTVESLTTYSEQHPPLYFIIANLWGRVFSYHNIVIKLLSVFFGILTLATVFRLAKDIGGGIVGFYSLLIASTSVLFLFYTHDIRQYTLGLFLTTLVWLFYHRMIKQLQTVRLLQFAVLTLATAGTMYTHYSTIFILIPIGFYHVLFVRKTKLWWQVSGAFTLAGGLFLPWLPTAIEGLGGHSSKIEDGRKLYMQTPELIETVTQFLGNGSSVIFILITVLFFTAVIVNLRGSRYALFYIVASSIVIVLMNEYFHLVSYMRYIIVYIIPFSICAGVGLSFFHRWRILPFIPILICVSWLVIGTQFRTDDKFYEQTQTIIPQFFVEFNHLIPFIQDMPSSDDTILVPVIRHYGLTRLSKQQKKSILDYYLSWLDMPYTNIYSGQLARDPFVLDDVWQAVQGYQSIWLTYPIGDLYEIRKFKKRIKDTYTLCQMIDYGVKSLLEQYVINEHVDNLCAN